MLWLSLLLLSTQPPEQTAPSARQVLDANPLGSELDTAGWRCELQTCTREQTALKPSAREVVTLCNGRVHAVELWQEYKPQALVSGMRTQIASTPSLGYHLWGISSSTDPHLDTIQLRQSLANELASGGLEAGAPRKVESEPSGGMSGSFTSWPLPVDVGQSDLVQVLQVTDLRVANPSLVPVAGETLETGAVVLRKRLRTPCGGRDIQSRSLPF